MTTAHPFHPFHPFGLHHPGPRPSRRAPRREPGYDAGNDPGGEPGGEPGRRRGRRHPHPRPRWGEVPPWLLPAFGSRAAWAASSDDDGSGFDPGPPTGSRRGSGRGFGPGFGPGFPGGWGHGGGPGFGPGFGPGAHGGPGRGRWGNGRRGRGNVRAAILALLAEEPRHGYAVMTELAERSGGMWRPSPGSVYPVLQQLQDEGLVTAQDGEGRRVFTLTDAGRRYVEENAEALREPWKVDQHGAGHRVRSLLHAMAALGAAVEQVARLGDEAQAARALTVLEEARRSMYRILAGDDVEEEGRRSPGGPAEPA